MEEAKTYTMTDMAAELGAKSAQDLRRTLERCGLVVRAGRTWKLTARHAGRGYTEMRAAEYRLPSGMYGASWITVWTEAGRTWLRGVMAGCKAQEQNFFAE